MKHFDIDFSSVKACVYRGEFEGYGGFLRPIVEFQCVEAAHLVGISEIITALRGNTQSFLDNAGASNVLLWGARGCGKSSSMRAVLCEFLHSSDTLRVVEIPKPSLAILPHLVDFLRTQPYKFVIMCDDLCFGRGDESYKALKSILDGGFEAQARIAAALEYNAAVLSHWWERLAAGAQGSLFPLESRRSSAVPLDDTL